MNVGRVKMDHLSPKFLAIIRKQLIDKSSMLIVGTSQSAMS